MIFVGKESQKYLKTELATGIEIPIFEGSPASLKGGAVIIAPTVGQQLDAPDVDKNLRYTGVYTK